MNKGKLESVCLVRWMAALFVMTGHMYCLMVGTPPTFLWNAIHRLGIIIFFVLGGYLVTGSWARDPHLKNYFIKRVSRIFPPLILFVVIAACIVGPMLTTLSLYDYFHNPLFFRYFFNIGLYINYALPGVFESNPYPYAVNGSIWSLPVEVFMYLLVPLFYRIGKKSLKCDMVLVFGVCLLAIIKKLCFPTFFYVIYGTDVGSLIEIVPFYFVGMLIYILMEQGIFRYDFSPEWAIIVIAFSFVFSNVSQLSNMILTFVCVPIVVFGIAKCEKNAFIRILSKYEITYGIFLYVFFVQQCVIYLNIKYSLNIGFSILYGIAIIITILISIVSYRFVEKPISNWTKKIIG